ncbi:MAG TPA: sigma-70 family RNA polymerase sigma factor [Terriglobia bacterium]|nr:sigma-70 family RNA polymerase sigma factor [Terriglobia bacterium]
MSSLATRVLNGDHEAYGELYQEFRPRLLGLCQYILGSPDEAEDASNEVFVRLPAALKSYDASLPFSRWLTSVAGHYCVDLLRRRRSERRVIEPAGADQPEPAAPASSPLADLLAQEDQRAVRDAIARLPERYSAALVLRYYNELSYDEIAERLGTNRDNVKTLIFRAKEKLRRTLSKHKTRSRSGSSRRFAPACSSFA